MTRIFLFSLLLLLCSCAHPTARLPNTNHYDKTELKRIRRSMSQSAYRYRKDLTRRVNSVHYDIIKSTGEELCDRKLVPDIGVVYVRVTKFNESRFFNPSYDINKEQHEDTSSVFKQSPQEIRLQVILKNSVAEKAGLKEGDVLLSIYGVPAPSGDKAFEKLADIIKRNGKAGLPFEIEVERGGKNLSFSFEPDMVCPYPLIIDAKSQVLNAFADGEKIYITVEMIDYIKDDNDLAAILAHELAHNTLGHSSATEHNMTIGLVLGTISDVFLGTSSSYDLAKQGQLAYSKEFEFEADYVSAYYMARAGYDYKNSKKMQERIASRDVLSLYYNSKTHPTPQKRFALLQESANEIDMKKAFGEVLIPNFNETNEYLRKKKD